MTLGIAFVHPYIAGIITDRRLTAPKGGAKFDDITKCGVVDFQDGRLVYTFSGLAQAPGFDAASVIANELCAAGAGGATTFDALHRFAEALTARFAKLKLPPSVVDKEAAKRLSIVFSGFTYEADQPTSRTFLVSNYQAPHSQEMQKAEPVFSGYAKSCERDESMYFGVGSNKWHDDDLENFRDKLARLGPVPFDAVLIAGAQIIESTARLDSSVGNECSIVYTVPDRGSCKLGKVFFPDKPTSDVPIPTYILAAYGNAGAFIISKASERRESRKMQPVPRTHRNHPCPCGSGKKYKLCHATPVAPSLKDNISVMGSHKIIAYPDDYSAMTLMSFNPKTHELFLDDHLGEYFAARDHKRGDRPVFGRIPTEGERGSGESRLGRQEP
jgi:hypothetical protein